MPFIGKKIVQNQVTGTDIVDGTLVTADIADGAVSTVKIAADAVDGTKLADNAVNSEHYTDGSIDTAHIADANVTTIKIADDAVTGDKLANDVAISTSGAITTTGAFTSVGIDDNADATAVTISSDEDVSLSAGDLTVSRNEANGTVRLNLSNTGSNGSTEFSEIKFNSTAGGTQTSVVQHRNNYGLNFGTTTNHAVYLLQNNANALSVDTSKNVTVNSGNLVIGTSGKGIDFSATAGTSASNATTQNELLSDYEQGIWTPANLGTNITYSTAVGHYTKVGRLVTASFQITVASNSSASNLHITNLPYQLASANEYGGGFIHYENTPYTDLRIYGHDATFVTALNGSTVLTGANLSGLQMLGMLVYFTS